MLPEILQMSQDKKSLKMALSGACKPGSTLNIKTGGWRIFFPVFMYENCTKCGNCALVCPDMAIEPREDNFFEHNYDYCKGCGVCANECPTNAIKMVLEEK